MPNQQRRQLLKATAFGGIAALAGCLGDDGDDDAGTGDDGSDAGNGTGEASGELNYVHPSYFGADAADLVPMFEEGRNISVSTQSSPGDATSTREYYVNQFIAESGDFDVGNMDIIWPGEFAGNQWAAEMEDPEGHTDNMLNTPVDAMMVDGAMYGMPLHTDANALYYRTDKLEEYGYDGPPETYTELVNMAEEILEEDDEITNGYVWQGGTNEGLTIMWLNWVWGMDGEVWDGDSVTVNHEEGVAALQHAVDLIHEYEITPEFMPSSATDENRETFQQGSTLFMRNWPYAVSLMNEEGSPVQGDFSVAPLPTHEDHPDAHNSCLGGWNLFINANAQNVGAAQEFATFAASLEAQEHLAREHSRLPVREEVYENEEIREEFEELALFENILERTRARPPLISYPTFSEIVFTEANRALVQDKTPQEALDDAQEEIEASIDEA